MSNILPSVIFHPLSFSNNKYVSRSVCPSLLLGKPTISTIPVPTNLKDCLLSSDFHTPTKCLTNSLCVSNFSMFFLFFVIVIINNTIQKVSIFPYFFALISASHPSSLHPLTLLPQRTIIYQHIDLLLGHRSPVAAVAELGYWF